MSTTLFILSLQPISKEQFVKSLEAVGARYWGIDQHANEHRGQFKYQEYGSAIDIYLARDPMESISDEDKNVISKLGGKPRGAITIEPLGGEDIGKLARDYLAKLADEVPYVVTDFDELCVTGKELQEKKELNL